MTHQATTLDFLLFLERTDINYATNDLLFGRGLAGQHEHFPANPLSNKEK